MSFAEYSRAVAGGGLGRRDDPTQLLLNNIQQINYNVSQIPKLVSHLGNPTKDSQEHRARLRELIDSTKRLALDTNKGLKSIPSGAEGGEEVKIYLVRINIITQKFYSRNGNTTNSRVTFKTVWNDFKRFLSLRADN